MSYCLFCCFLFLFLRFTTPAYFLSFFVYVGSMLFGTICRLTDHFEEVYFTFQCFICSLKGRERAIISQTNIGTVSKGTLGKLLRDEMERMWAFPSA